MQQAVLYNKGMGVACCTFDSPTKKDEKKMANYLVVSNNCILSSRAGLYYIFFSSHVRARGVARSQ